MIKFDDPWRNMAMRFNLMRKRAADTAIFTDMQPTPFLAKELSTAVGSLAHVFTTYIVKHMEQPSRIRRESGIPKGYQTA